MHNISKYLCSVHEGDRRRSERERVFVLWTQTAVSLMNIYVRMCGTSNKTLLINFPNILFIHFARTKSAESAHTNCFWHFHTCFNGSHAFTRFYFFCFVYFYFIPLEQWPRSESQLVSIYVISLIVFYAFWWSLLSQNGSNWCQSTTKSMIHRTKHLIGFSMDSRFLPPPYTWQWSLFSIKQ